jgi:protein AroM
MADERIPRIAVVTVGRSPRPDVLAELVGKLGQVRCEEFATFDDVPTEVLAEHAPGPREAPFFARLGEGNYVILSVTFVEQHVARLVVRLDDLGYDLIVIAATALFAPLRARTPIVHGQRAVDAWVAALVVGDLKIGLIYPLPRQGDQLATFEHRTQFQSAHASINGGYSEHLTEAAGGVSAADLIVMHSIGYTEAMAQLIVREGGKPAVTARRIIAAAIRLRLSEIVGRSIGPIIDSYTGFELLKRLPESEALLTLRERQVLEGRSNKVIGRALKISYRTVEIHRARAMTKLRVISVTQLIRRAITATAG